MDKLTIGNAIRKAREARGYSRERLARKAGISQITILQWEHGMFSPTVELLWRVADALDISLDELIGRRL